MTNERKIIVAHVGGVTNGMADFRCGGEAGLGALSAFYDAPVAIDSVRLAEPGDPQEGEFERIK